MVGEGHNVEEGEVEVLGRAADEMAAEATGLGYAEGIGVGIGQVVDDGQGETGT